MTAASPASFTELLDWVCTIQQIPAPTFHEEQRAAYMLAEFERVGMPHVEQDAAGNVLARWPGESGKCLVVSAHLDTVHGGLAALPLERTDSRLTGPSVADNSTGLAVLLALARHLVGSRTRYPGDVWLAANVGEEGLGNLIGMHALVDRFGKQARAYLVLEGLGLGQVCHRGLGVKRLQVTAETAGGHSWVDYGTPSAIHELAKIAARLDGLPLPQRPRSSLNIGVIHGGTSINTIASQAYFQLDLRAEDQKTLLKVSDKVMTAIQLQEAEGVKISVEQIGLRPAGAIPADHPLVRLALAVLDELHAPSALEIGSTDANDPLNRGYPAICLGLTRGNFPHTAREFIEIEPLKTGLAQLLLLLDRVWQLPH